jgi:hypothetical protein
MMMMIIIITHRNMKGCATEERTVTSNTELLLVNKREVNYDTYTKLISHKSHHVFHISSGLPFIAVFHNLSSFWKTPGQFQHARFVGRFLKIMTW